MRHLLASLAPVILALGILTVATAAPKKGNTALQETPPTDSVKRLTMTDRNGNILSVQLTNMEGDKIRGPEVPHPAPAKEEGELAYVAVRPHKGDMFSTNLTDMFYTDIPPQRVTGAENFKAPAPDSGTVHPKAKVVFIKAGGRNMALALDALTPDAQYYEVLRLDLSGKGQFKDAYLVPWHILIESRQSGRLQYDFQKYPVYIQIGERCYAAGFSCRYVEGPNELRLNLVVTTWAEGMCRFGDKVYKVRLRDCSGNNLRVDDRLRATLEAGEVAPWRFKTDGDTFEVVVGKGKNEQWLKGCYGHPIVVDGALWDVAVSADGGRVRAEPYAGPTGRILIDHLAWKACLKSEQNLLYVEGGQDPFPVPEGTYVPVTYEEWWSKEAAIEGTKHQCDPICVVVAKPVRVVAGQVANVLIGSPLKSTLTVRQEDDTLVFDVSHVDAQGAALQESYPQNKGTTMASIVVTEASGKMVDKVPHQRGDGLGLYRWKIPPGLRGTFMAAADYGENPRFPIQAEKITFSVPLGTPPRVVVPPPAPVSRRPASDASPASSAPRPAPAPAPAAVKPPAAAPAKDPAEERRLRAHSALQLATMLEKAGKIEPARREYERILKEYPDTDEAAQARERLQALKAAGDPAAP